jgi:hypothetical protein
MEDCQLDRDSARRRDECGTTSRGRIDNGLDRLRRVGAFNMDLIGNPGKTSFNLSFRITAAGFDVAGYLAFELIQLYIRHRRALYAPYLVAHHDPAEEISQGCRAGIVTAALLTFIRNKIVAFNHGAKLQPVKRLALYRGHRPLGLALFARSTLGKLPCGDFFEASPTSTIALLRKKFSAAVAPTRHQ